MTNKNILVGLVVGIVAISIISTCKKEPEPMDSKAEMTSAVVDFETMQAFSVERAKVGDSERTIVGWLLDGAIQQWYLDIPMEEHHRLLNEFNTFLNAR